MSASTLIKLPRLTPAWAMRCNSVAKELGVSPADVFWGVRFAQDLQFFSPAARTVLKARYRRVFTWVDECHRMLDPDQFAHRRRKA